MTRAAWHPYAKFDFTARVRATMVNGQMAWVDGRWVIDAGIVPAWAPSTWPGSQKAADAGWRPWVIEGVQR